MRCLRTARPCGRRARRVRLPLQAPGRLGRLLVGRSRRGGLWRQWRRGKVGRVEYRRRGGRVRAERHVHRALGRERHGLRWGYDFYVMQTGHSLSLAASAWCGCRCSHQSLVQGGHAVAKPCFGEQIMQASSLCPVSKRSPPPPPLDRSVPAGTRLVGWAGVGARGHYGHRPVAATRRVRKRERM